MASTIRLAESLKAEAVQYAQEIGLSLNALCAVAVREYLDRRKYEGVPVRTPAPSAPVLKVEPPAPSRPAPASAARSRSNSPAGGLGLGLGVPVVAPDALCPCGSGRKYKNCHGRA